MDEAQDYLATAQENLAGTAGELAHRRLCNCGGDANYARLQATIAALLNEEFSHRYSKDRGQMTLFEQASSANCSSAEATPSDSAPAPDASLGHSAQG